MIGTYLLRPQSKKKNHKLTKVDYLISTASKPKNPKTTKNNRRNVLLLLLIFHVLFSIECL
jgi:hypothetical protein